MDRSQSKVRAVAADHDRSDGGRSDRHAGRPVRRPTGTACSPTRFFATAQYSRKTNHPRFGNTSTRPAGFAVPHHRPRLAGRAALRTALLRSHRSRGSRQQPADRQRRRISDRARGSARMTSRRGAGKFSRILRGGNSQSSTGYLFNTDYATPRASRSPMRPAASCRCGSPAPDDGRQHAADARRRARHHDHVVLRRRIAGRWRALTLDLGLRYEHVGSEATGGAESINAQSWVPRLAAAYQLREARTHDSVGASYAHYSGTLHRENYFSRNTLGRPTPAASRASTSARPDRARLRTGLRPANYSITAGSFPTANMFFDEDLPLPLTREFTLSAAQHLAATAKCARCTCGARPRGLVESFTTTRQRRARPP